MGCIGSKFVPRENVEGQTEEDYKILQTVGLEPYDINIVR
jgi:hypothetical protein